VGCGLVALMLASLTSLSSAAEPSESNAQIQKRLDALESELTDLKIENQKTEPVRTFTAKNFRFGGFGETVFTSLIGHGPNRNSVNETEGSLFISADITDKTRFFSETEFEHNSALIDGNTPGRHFGTEGDNVGLEIAEVTHDFSNAFSLKVGRMITPFGIINVEHFEPSLIQHDKPQFLREVSDTEITMFDLQVRGLDAIGRFSPFTDHHIKLESYAGTVRTDPNKIAGGGRQSWSFPNDRVTLGFSQQAGTRDERTFVTLGEDLKISYKKFTLKSEAAQTSFTGHSITAFYVQPLYFLTPRWGVFGQVDYLDNVLNKTDDIIDPIKKYEYTTGVNFLPISNVRLRGEVTVHDYQGNTGTFAGVSRDYVSVQTSVVVSW